jgi:drug/metabolite transporter (DMT)-like permease
MQDFSLRVFLLMLKRPSSQLLAVAQALFVTLLWSTSWVLIKLGLADIPALTFAGLRYGLAFIVLLSFFLRPGPGVALRQGVRALSRPAWGRLLLLGLLYYTLTQGTQFLGLVYLPAVTASLLLNFSPVAVALLGMPLLGERPSAAQWLGVGLSVAGALVYFYPVALPPGQAFGFFVVLVGVLANAGSAILGRQINQAGDISPLVVTMISMGTGSAVLLGAGLLLEGWSTLSFFNWALIAWLAVVNTALAFTLWNHTLRTLPAVESSVINNTMLIQIAVLAWIFLDERLDLIEITGLFLAGLGTLAVQLRRRLI